MHVLNVWWGWWILVKKTPQRCVWRNEEGCAPGFWPCVQGPTRGVLAVRAACQWCGDCRRELSASRRRHPLVTGTRARHTRQRLPLEPTATQPSAVSGAEDYGRGDGGGGARRPPPRRPPPPPPLAPGLGDATVGGTRRRTCCGHRPWCTFASSGARGASPSPAPPASWLQARRERRWDGETTYLQTLRVEHVNEIDADVGRRRRPVAVRQRHAAARRRHRHRAAAVVRRRRRLVEVVRRQGRLSEQTATRWRWDTHAARRARSTADHRRQAPIPPPLLRPLWPAAHPQPAMIDQWKYHWATQKVFVPLDIAHNTIPAPLQIGNHSAIQELK